MPGIINSFSKINILVIGDIILDRYIQGSVSRISPEAPVPVVLESNFSHRSGGAANVANNVSALGAHVTQIGIIGNDFEGLALKRNLKKGGVDTSGIFVDKNLPTVTKTRIIAKNQQIVRIDREKVKEKSGGAVTKKIHNFIDRNIENYHAIIISDYGKGLVTGELVDFVCMKALQKKKIVMVDPKVENFNYYRKVTAITPNLQEAENAIRNIKMNGDSKRVLRIKLQKLDTMKNVNLAGQELLRYLDLQCLLITLGEEGMRLFEKGKSPVSIKTKAQEVYDVTGAGDAVISVFTLAIAVGATKIQAAKLANLAAGIVVGKLGAVAVTAEELKAAIKKS